jgi:hypothetical protein
MPADGGELESGAGNCWGGAVSAWTTSLSDKQHVCGGNGGSDYPIR